jgi:hypothetical protein
MIADESLYNNLIQLQTSLNSLVPTINLPEFGIQKLSTQSKNTIKDILNKYTEGFYLLSIPQSLDALFEKYAPEAEKIRSAEKAGADRALESARGMRTPASPETAGIGSDSYGYGYGYDSYNPYSDYNYNPYDSYNPYGDYNYPSDYNYGSDTSSSNAGGGKGGSRGGNGGGSSGSRRDKEEPGKESDKNKPKGIIPQHDIERAIADIKTGLDDIAAAMTDEEGNPTKGNPTKLANLAETINNDTEIDVILAGSTLSTIVDRKLDTVAKALETINKKALNSTDLSHYKKEVEKAFDKNKNELEKLSKAIDTFGKTEDIENAAKEAKKKGLPADKTTKKKIETLSKEKQWAYFGGDDTLLGTDTNKLGEKITSRANLLDIKTKINKLLADMKKFLGKKSEVPAVTTPKKQDEPVITIPDTSTSTTIE